jgi:hypothetical protein
VAYEKAQLEYDIIARRQAVFSALFDLIVGRESEYREFKLVREFMRLSNIVLLRSMTP